MSNSKEPIGPKNEDHALWTIVGYLTSGLIIWGGIGWGLDNWFNTDFLVVIGMLTGLVASLYVVWLRFGRN